MGMANSGSSSGYKGDALSMNDFEESEIDWMLSLTPEQRLQRHDNFLELVRALREAGRKFYGRDPGSPEEID